MVYQAQWNYRSDQGFFEEGQVVELTEVEAEMFNRDSPGIFVAWTGEAPPQDRQVKNPPRRRDRQGDPGDAGVMSTETFRAVKDR